MAVCIRPTTAAARATDSAGGYNGEAGCRRSGDASCVAKRARVVNGYLKVIFVVYLIVAPSVAASTYSAFGAAADDVGDNSIVGMEILGYFRVKFKLIK